MEVNNRFDAFASFSIDQESDESFSIDINLPKQIQDKTQSTRNFWEVPEYVKKIIPCVVPIEVKEQTTTPSIVKAKKSRSNRKQKSIEHIAQTEEKEEQVDVESTPVVEAPPQQSIDRTYYPPQPYKFKPSAANHRNEKLPKFNRQNMVLPKHTTVRGNSKSCTHQI